MVTVTLMRVNEGKMEALSFVIGKYAKPRCFKGVNVSNLVKYVPYG